MYKQTLWYEIYSGRKIKWDSFNKYFGKNGSDESWYIYYVEEDDEPRFELHAHIDGDTVTSAEPFKADVYGGHGRPIIDERVSPHPKRNMLFRFSMNASMTELEKHTSISLIKRSRVK